MYLMRRSEVSNPTHAAIFDLLPEPIRTAEIVAHLGAATQVLCNVDALLADLQVLKAGLGQEGTVTIASSLSPDGEEQIWAAVDTRED